MTYLPILFLSSLACIFEKFPKPWEILFATLYQMKWNNQNINGLAKISRCSAKSLGKVGSQQFYLLPPSLASFLHIHRFTQGSPPVSWVVRSKSFQESFLCHLKLALLNLLIWLQVCVCSLLKKGF
jgi:hypothetical protein